MFDVYRQDILDFFHEKFLKIASIVSAVLAGFVFLSAISYDSADPSFNNATDKFPSNLMGYAGAHTSDLLYQFFGWCGAPILALCLMMWAYRFYSGRFITKFWLRAIALVFAIACASAVFSSIAGIGGVIGGFLQNKLYLELTPPIYNSLFIIAGLALGHFATGLRLRETKEFFQKVRDFCFGFSILPKSRRKLYLPALALLKRNSKKTHQLQNISVKLRRRRILKLQNRQRRARQVC